MNSKEFERFNDQFSKLIHDQIALKFKFLFHSNTQKNMYYLNIMLSILNYSALLQVCTTELHRWALWLHKMVVIILRNLWSKNDLHFFWGGEYGTSYLIVVSIYFLSAFWMLKEEQSTQSVLHEFKPESTLDFPLPLTWQCGTISPTESVSNLSTRSLSGLGVLIKISVKIEWLNSVLTDATASIIWIRFILSRRRLSLPWGMYSWATCMSWSSGRSSRTLTRSRKQWIPTKDP